MRCWDGVGAARLHDAEREAVAVAPGDQREASGFGAHGVLKLLLLHGYRPCTEVMTCFNWSTRSTRVHETTAHTTG